MTFVPGTNESEQQDQDLTAALSEGETAFVAGEQKKSVSTSTLGLFGLLALCAGGMYLMYVRGGPKPAAAADVETADTITTFLADGEKHVTLMKQMLKDTDKVVQRFRQTSTRSQVPLAALSTNPFQMLSDEPAVAHDDSASSRRRRDEERAAAMQAVRELKVQSILLGSRKAALLNGQLVQEGMEVDGFIVEQISAGAVVVRRNVFRFELKMAK